jgi:hypothetical protein
MLFTISTVLVASAGVSAVSIPVRRDGISVTPHDKFSSSIGAIGCKLDTNRVAYWPEPIDCNNICVKVTNGDRSLHLLKIDQSGGAHDISYDAWNELISGTSAKTNPQVGGGVAMTYEYVPADECKPLLQDGILSLSASNSMNYLASCLSQPDSWVAQNHQLVNIMDSQCKWGFDEVCTLNLQESNQAKCANSLGYPNALPESSRVKDIEYATGLEVNAL